jgi:hypothetical protein
MMVAEDATMPMVIATFGSEHVGAIITAMSKTVIKCYY